MIGLLFLALVALVLVGAALNDLYWRRQGFRTVVKGRGKNRVILRVPLDGSEPVPPEDPRDLREPDGEDGTEPRQHGG